MQKRKKEDVPILTHPLIVWSKLRAVSPKAFIHKHRINAFALTGRGLRAPMYPRAPLRFALG